MGIEMYSCRKYIVLELKINFCENLRILDIQWGVNLFIY